MENEEINLEEYVKDKRELDGAKWHSHLVKFCDDLLAEKRDLEAKILTFRMLMNDAYTTQGFYELDAVEWIGKYDRHFEIEINRGREEKEN